MIEILSRFFHCGFAFYFIPVKIPAQLKNPEQVRMKYSPRKVHLLEPLVWLAILGAGGLVG